jgi:Flp pilus assembly protein CpaB
MLVLAVDTIANRDNQTNSILGSTVTLAASPEEAQRLSLAAALGELRLTLRTPDDNKIVRLPGAKWEDLGKPTRDNLSGKEDEEPVALVSAPPVPPLPPLPKDAPPPMSLTEKTPEKAPEPVSPPPLETHTMTIVSGDYVQKAVFTRDPVEKVWTNGSLSRGTADAPPRRTPRPSLPAPADKNGAKRPVSF